MWSSMHPRQLQSSTSFCTLRIGCPACTIHPHSTLWWLQSINSRAMVSTSYLIFHRPHHFTPICCHMPLSFPLTFMHWRRVTICMTSQYQPRPICMCSFFSVADSNFLPRLSYHLPGLTDELVDRIGPRYLKRLFFLHMGRADALKRILLPPPHPHPPTLWCDFEEQKRLARAWALASAYLAWEARPGMYLLRYLFLFDILMFYLF